MRALLKWRKARPAPEQVKPAPEPEPSAWQEKKFDSGWHHVGVAAPLPGRYASCPCEGCVQIRAEQGRSLFPDVPIIAADTEGREYRIDGADAGVIYLNGRVVTAYWEHTNERPSNEVFERAVRLAIAAHPETMYNFPCGKQLGPGHP